MNWGELIVGAYAVLVVALAFLGFTMLYRNNKVFNLRREMVEKLFSYPDWEWRVKDYEKVDYSSMVYQFWKPIQPESWYKDTSFLRADAPVRSWFQPIRKNEN